MKRGAAFALALVGLALAAPGPDAPAKPAAVLRIVIDGPITPATSEFITDALETAVERGSAAVLIELDTPGGLLPSTRQIVKSILDAPVPVIVYVAPSGAGAGSAGVFITMAAHVAAMAPGTNIGAAHPVGGQGQDIEGAMGEKVENFTASFAEAIAERRGRNVEWAVKAVRESASVTAEEAARLEVVDFVARDTRAVLTSASARTVDVGGEERALALADARVDDYAMRFPLRILALIADPNIAYLLMMAGMLGLYIEITTPGFGFPGVLGAICLVLALTALHVLSVNYGALALVALGVALLIAEAFSPSFGLLGGGGVVAFLLGSLFLFDSNELGYGVARSLVLQAGLAFALLLFGLSFLVVRAYRRPVRTGREGLIGERGIALAPVGRTGRVRVHGEQWAARADGPEIGQGEDVEVVAVEGLVLLVGRPKGDG
jgi:membrane-bound serine protease (ClpP class)